MICQKNLNLFSKNTHPHIIGILLHGVESFLRCQLRNFRHFMELKDSLPPSEQPTSCPYCVPHESNYCTPFLFLWALVSLFSLYSRWCVSVRFPHQNASLLPHVCHMTSQLTPSLFDQPNNIWWGTQIMKLLIMQSSPVPCSLVSLRLIYLQHPVVKHSQCMFFP